MISINLHKNLIEDAVLEEVSIREMAFKAPMTVVVEAIQITTDNLLITKGATITSNLGVVAEQEPTWNSLVGPLSTITRSISG